MTGWKALALAGGLSMAMWSCNSPGSSLGPVDQASLVGKWRVSNLKEEGSSEIKATTPVAIDSVTPMNSSHDYTDTSYYFQFLAGGTCVYSQPSATAKTAAAEAATSCTWSLSGSTLTTTIAGAAPSQSQVGISGSTLTDVTVLDTTRVLGYFTYIEHLKTTVTAVKM